MGPQGDFLHDFEPAQVLDNMSNYMHPESSLNLNLEATQSPENAGNTKFLSPLKDASHEAEANVEAIREAVHQPGDTVLVENIQAGLSTKNIGQGEEVDTEMHREGDTESGDTVLLGQSQDEKPGSLEAEIINDTVSRIVAPPKNYRDKLKNIRKEQQKLCKTVKRLRRKIKEIATGKVSEKTLETTNMAVKT